MTVRIGISGWRYAGWRGHFYPSGLRQADELAFVGRTLHSVEINGTHYCLQSPESFMQWREATPPDFVFAIKGARYLTHMLRFRDASAQVALANFFAQGLLALNAKLGPLLWQFPPNYAFDPVRLEHFVSLLPSDTEAAARLAEGHDGRVKHPFVSVDRKRPLRHAIEIRHPSFRDERFVQLLRRHRCALVVSDSTAPWPYAEDLTAPFVYLRLHGSETKYAGAYTDTALQRFAQRIACWQAGGQPTDAHLIAPDLPPPKRASRDVYCYFDNDVKSQAPFDAQRLMALLG